MLCRSGLAARGLWLTAGMAWGLFLAQILSPVSIYSCGSPSCSLHRLSTLLCTRVELCPTRSVYQLRILAYQWKKALPPQSTLWLQWPQELTQTQTSPSGSYHVRGHKDHREIRELIPRVVWPCVSSSESRSCKMMFRSVCSVLL